MFEQQHRWDELPQADGPGVYAYFLLDRNALPPIQIDLSGILYVGMTESSLNTRCHFTHAHSGFSTFRRSLGAILKQALALKALPRSLGSSPTNTRNFRFDEEGEARLTEWMRQNLRYGHVPLAGDVEQTEAAVIQALSPPLNLKGWKSPQKPLVQRFRRACVAEAASMRGAAQSGPSE